METKMAFDAVARTYDQTFSDTPLGRLLRRRVWQRLASTFRPGDEVLELACGTGEDAVWLAQQGVQMTATDASAEMVAIARRKARQASVSDHVSLYQISLEEIITGQSPLSSVSSTLRSVCNGGGEYDGVFSNFGGLNNTGAWREVAEALGQLVRRGGRILLVVMGPICPWEIGWHLLHGEWRRAFRRFGGASTAKVGGTTVQVWYPSPRRLRSDFAPWFRHLETESLGLWLPPSYLGHLVARWPRLFAWLDGVERASGGLAGGWGDHFIAVFERK